MLAMTRRDRHRGRGVAPLRHLTSPTPRLSTSASAQETLATPSSFLSDPCGSNVSRRPANGDDSSRPLSIRA